MNNLLTKPIPIHHLTLRNRIAMPPMATGKAVDGMPDDTLITHYTARAKVTGLIIVEHEYVSPEGMAHKTQLSIAEDRVIPAYQKLTAAVRNLGAAIFAQISHAGAQARDTGVSSLSPSGISLSENAQEAVEMTSADIAHVIDAFAAAARRAKDAGFDGVELHSAHGYLLNQFYSPLTNRRTDAYSGSTLEGRTRLHCEIIRAVRDTVGPDYPVAIRFGAYDYKEGGSLREEIPAACRIFESAGIDLIDISGGLNGTSAPGNPNPGWFSDLSRLAKDAVSIPVLVTGGVKTPQDAEDILQRGDADIIGVGRAMLQDPEWAERI